MVSETEDLPGFICSVTECLFWHSAPRVHPGTPIALVPLDPCILELGGPSSKLASFLDLIYIHIYFCTSTSGKLVSDFTVPLYSRNFNFSIMCYESGESVSSSLA